MDIPFADMSAYVRGALLGLWFVERRRPFGRRFGADADARWKAFAGGLQTHARIELLIRDADAEWPGAFGAKTVFDLRDVAEDDAFGAKWPGLDPVLADELWREPPPEVHGSTNAAAQALASLAQVWGLTLAPVTPPALDPADRLWVAGPSAIAAAAVHFAEHEALSWADQVTCVATSPAHRQLAAFAGAVAEAKRPVGIRAGMAAGKRPAGVKLLCSADAAAEDKAALGPLGQEGDAPASRDSGAT